MANLYRLGEKAPEIDADAFLAPTATLIGAVRVAARASVWFGALLRGDNEPITVGEGSNVQDGCVMHTDPGFPLIIEQDCTIGHSVILHGCHIGAGSLVGMGATVLNGAKIGPRCLVGAGALVTEGKEFEEGSLILGSPAKRVRALGESDYAMLKQGAAVYVARSAQYRENLAQV